MANITELLQKILNARYGKDVRGSIHDAIQAMNQEIEDDRPTVINSMERAETAAETAEKYASDSERSKETADVSAKMAKSYTHGGTGLRENEDTDNAKYYKEQVENKALLIEEYSQTASDAAQTATEAANRAEQSVSSIGTSVEDAQAAATSAIESASSASNDAQNALQCASAALESAESSSQSASEAQASAEAAARSAEEAKQAAGGDFVTHQEVGQPDGVASLDKNGKVPSDQLPKVVAVDSEMSKESENPLQNKVITEQIEALTKAIEDATALRASLEAYGMVKLCDSEAVTDSTGLALPATEKNASIEGTLAYQLSQLNTDLLNYTNVTDNKNTYVNSGSAFVYSKAGNKVTVQCFGSVNTDISINYILCSNFPAPLFGCAALTIVNQSLGTSGTLLIDPSGNLLAVEEILKAGNTFSICGNYICK